MLFCRKSRLIGSVFFVMALTVAGCASKDEEGPGAGKQFDKAMDRAGQMLDKAQDGGKEITRDAVNKTEAAADAAGDGARQLVRGPLDK